HTSAAANDGNRSRESTDNAMFGYETSESYYVIRTALLPSMWVVAGGEWAVDGSVERFSGCLMWRV
ncbi:MAG: hypothetical protein U9N78_02120, partial [Actinomycetota bacterium]|nr:hypothetical protein [Actinomycetota bacterium]